MHKLEGSLINTASHRLYDRGPSWLWQPGSSQQAHYVYIDNLGLMGDNSGEVTNQLEVSCKEFEEDNLKLHEMSVGEGGGEALGVYIDGKRHCTRNTLKRFGYVRKACYAILGMSTVSGQVIETYLGHCTYCSLVNRDLLSCFHAAYAFVQKCYFKPAVLWKSVRDELRAFLGLLIYAEGCWDWKWSSHIYMFDSSLTGYSISSSEVSAERVGAVGRVHEKSRWRLGAEQCREKSLSAAGYCLNAAGKPLRDSEGALVPLPPDVAVALEADRWEKDENFPEVPPDVLQFESWRSLFSSPWRFSENILLLEARALEKTVERIGLSQPSSSMRFLIFGDNMSVILSFSRRRAKNFKLLTLIRRVAAMGLARGIRFYFRWIPSELNHADKGSRLFDGDVSDPVFSKRSNDLPTATDIPDPRNGPNEPPPSGKDISDPTTKSCESQKAQVVKSSFACVQQVGPANYETNSDARQCAQEDADVGGLERSLQKCGSKTRCTPRADTATERSEPSENRFSDTVPKTGGSASSEAGAQQAVDKHSFRKEGYGGQAAGQSRGVSGNGGRQTAAKPAARGRGRRGGVGHRLGAKRRRDRLSRREEYGEEIQGANFERAWSEAHSEGSLMQKHSKSLEQALGADLPSFLELAAVGDVSLSQYVDRLLSFSSSIACSFNQLPLDEVDGRLVQFFNQQFFLGKDAWVGEKLLGAIGTVRPEVITKGCLSRSLRCLKGWRRLTPTMSKKPETLPVWAALCTEFVRMGHPRLAVMQMVGLGGYLRVMELLGVKFGDFQPPSAHGVRQWSLHLFAQEQAARSKTGQSDESVPLDAPYLLALRPAFEVFNRQPPGAKVVDLTYLDYVCLFKKAARQINMKHMVASLARGAGASIDRASGFRTLASIQKHGRRKVASSVSRYEKQNRLNQSWHDISAPQQKRFEACLENLPRALLAGQMPSA